MHISPKKSAYRKDNEKYNEKYNEIWEKVKNDLSEPVYNEKYLKAKMISYNGKTHTSFHDNEIPKEGSQLVCLSVILFTELV